MIRNILFAAANSSWTPLELFKNGEQGIWLDASDYSTLFQDSSGTTPVTSTSQPVGLWQDKSGTGNHISQATSSKRGQTTTTGTRMTVQFDGVDDELTRTITIISGSDGLSVGFGGYVQGLSGGGNCLFVSWSTNYDAQLDSTTQISSYVLDATTGALATGLSYPKSLSLIAYGKQGTTYNTLELDGNTTTSTSTMTASPSSTTLKIPGRSNRGDVRVSQFIVVNRQLTSTEKQQLKDYLASKG